MADMEAENPSAHPGGRHFVCVGGYIQPSILIFQSSGGLDKKCAVVIHLKVRLRLYSLLTGEALVVLVCKW